MLNLFLLRMAFGGWLVERHGIVEEFSKMHMDGRKDGLITGLDGWL
jgi:hypothetical protein